MFFKTNFTRVLIILSFLFGVLHANQPEENYNQSNIAPNQENLVTPVDVNTKKPNVWIPVAVAVPTFTAITVFGVKSWEWQLYKIKQGDLKWNGEDGWFGEDTGYGGADKLGHAYSTMLISNTFIESMRYAGYSDNTSALTGSLMAFLLMSYIEIGDATADHYGFEPADTVFNGLGALLSYAFYKYPRFNDFVDYRLEYEISSSLFSDIKSTGSTYETQKYNLVFQMSGFKNLRYASGPVKYLEYLEFGGQYYVRGFKDPADERKRTLKFIVGFNVPLGIDRLNKNDYRVLNATSTFFNYIQMPYTYVGAGKTFY